MKIERFAQNPIIRPNMDNRMGSNINGPSLIRVPDWIEAPLGKYYVYFGHHRGLYIRLAYADRVEGPWKMYEPGTIDIGQTEFVHHIASPDVHVDDERREIRMYYHGPVEGNGQKTRVAVSQDGIHFDYRPEILGNAYMRVFQWGGAYHAIAMPGRFYQSADGLTDFETGPVRYTPDMRHAAVKLDGNVLSVFYTIAHDCPERILLTTIDLTGDWMEWQPSEPITILAPETDYEGGNLPLAPSERGPINEPVRQLRDPAIFREDGRTYLIYAVAGEQGLALAEITEDK